MFNNSLLCSDSVYLDKIFDFSLAPSFLFYSYVPILLVSFLIGLFVLFKKNKTKLNYYFFGFIFSYSIFLLVEIIHWIAIPVTLVQFGWQLSILLHFLIIYFLLLFYYYLSFNKDISYMGRSLLILFAIPIVILLPTELNISGFDFEYCEGINGIFWNYIYILQIIATLLILRFSILKIRISDNKIKDIIFAIATIFFLMIFFSSNIWGDATLLYEVNILGPVGMFLFIILMMFAVVKYEAFNIKLLGPQALVLVLSFITFAALFIRKIENIRIILVVNIIFIAIIGYLLVRSVKKVNHQRELLEKANQNQQSLLHFITHQVKGYLTKSRNIFDGMLTGDYGEINDQVKDIVRHGFDSDTRGVETVMAILKASDLKTGKTEFKKEKANISSIVADVIEIKKDLAIAKNLDLTFEIEPNIYTQVDVLQIKEVFKNLITNSILYTIKGTINIVLKREKGKIYFAVIDTGIGLSPEDKEKLFTEGGKGKESVSMNVDSTGYGLYISRKIVNQHQGKIGANSEGRGKGSEFFVILPDIQ